MRAGAREMHVRGRVCVRENPAGNRRGSDVQSALARKRERKEEKERDAAGSDRPKEGRRRNAGWKSVRERQLPSPFLPTVEWRVGTRNGKGRESQEVEEDDNGEKAEGKGRE